MAIVIVLSFRHRPLLQIEKACYLAPGFRRKVWQLEKVWAVFPSLSEDLASSFLSSPTVLLLHTGLDIWCIGIRVHNLGLSLKSRRRLSFIDLA
jgi:hypothetical protein